ncbi:MAG: carboxymuconolactone decarboxylase family protein [Desulfovibrionaceae bacterium]
MNEKLQELTRKRKSAHARFLSMNSVTYAAFLDMERATYIDGALKKKHKELIAVEISVVIDCESCMQWHIEQAETCGARQHRLNKAE